MKYCRKICHYLKGEEKKMEKVKIKKNYDRKYMDKCEWWKLFG